MITPTSATKADPALTLKIVSRAAKRLFPPDSKDAKVFIAALAKMTFATESTLFESPFETHAASSKREIWLWFQNVYRVTEDDIRSMQEYVATLRED